MKRIKKTVVFVCFVVASNLLTGQNVKRYEGMMRWPSDLEQLKDLGITRIQGGEGYYDYYENSDGDRIKHGGFYFKASGFGKQGYNIKGTYSHGKKEGRWVFGDPLYDKEKQLKHSYLKITYKDDVFCGPCEYITRTTRDWPATVTIICNFNNGILTGEASVLYEFDHTSLTSECRGSFDKDGMLNGVWTISDKGGIEIIQKRYYY